MFAPPSGKAKAMVAATLRFGVAAGAGTIVYVNLGAKQGVQVGNYFRMFRYQGSNQNNVYEIPKGSYMTYGFGSPRNLMGGPTCLATF